MSTQSCVDCPSLIQGSDAASHFGISVFEAGDHVFCARFGHILGDGKGVREGLATRLGESCVSHGLARPTSAPAEMQTGKFMPRPDLLVPSTGVKPRSCNDCSKCDTSGVVTACAATGSVIFTAKAETIAASCSFGQDGTPIGTVDQELPDWNTTPVALSATSLGGGVTTSPTTTTSKPKSPPTPTTTTNFKILEPVDYSSDAKVSPEHAAKGIQAWRRVTSPKGREHFLPIFRTDFFDEEAQSRIPKSGADYGDPSLFIDHDNVLVEFAVQSYTRDLNLALIGEPGSGKTEAVRYIAWQMNMPLWRITYNEDTDPDEVLGFFHFGDHEVPDGQGGTKTVTGTYLKVGELPTRWQQMGVGLSDEPNTAREAIVQAYRSMNDSSRELVIYGQKFIRHDYCFHVMAMNPHYDFRNIGAKPMASADSRRLSFHLMTPPDESQIKQIIRRAVKTLDGMEVPDNVMKVLINAGKDLRQMTKLNQLPDFWTTSQEVKVARLVPDFGIVGAYRRAYFNYIDPEQAKVAISAIESHIPAGVDYR